jgi:hypothetical protein
MLIGALGLCMLALAGLAQAEPQRRVPLHYAVNLDGDYRGALAAGFNLADVSSAAALNRLPDGMRGVLWLRSGYNGRRNACAWRLSDERLRRVVASVRNHPRFSGIYFVADEPHPSFCPDAPARIAERSMLIRRLDPNARTFIIVLNSYRYPGEFALLRDSADYIGINPYPCNHKNVGRGCDLRAMRERIGHALAAGIEPERIVPVFQAFGQACTTAARSYHRLPTPDEARSMFEVWDELVPPDRRPFDMTYTWGPQPRSACPSLAMADGREHPDLRGAFAAYFGRLAAR